jgi:hypothetical protein
MAEVKVTRAERLLNKYVNGKVLTPSGRDWLVAALDPFHDTQLKELQGWPDVETGASVVRCIKASYQLSRPSGLTTDNWDCHVIMWPFHAEMDFSITTARRDNLISCTSTNPRYHFGGIQACAIEAGQPLQMSNLHTIATSSLDQTYTSGAGRLVGVGFEVTNTTAPNFRSGTCYTYRMMENAEEPSEFSMRDTAHLGGAVIVNGNFTGQPIRMPPIDVATAMLIPGTRSWAAEFGCYVIGAFHSVENKATAASYVEPLIMYDDQQETPITNTESFFFPTPTYNGVVHSDLASFPALKIDPIHQGGAIFTGLSKETSLTLNVIRYYESFPGPEQEDILVMATPSAEFDPQALSVYSHALSIMPVGVQVGENGLGDWFAGVIKKVSDWLSPALSAIPHPAAQAAAMVAKGLNAGSSAYLAPPSPSGGGPGKTINRKIGAAQNTGRGNSKPITNVPPANSKKMKILKSRSNAELKKEGYNPNQITQIRQSK